MSYNGVWYQNMFCHSKEVSSIKHILRWNLKICNSPFWCDGIQTHNSHQWKTFSEKKSYQIIEKSKLPVNLQSPVQLTYMCLDFSWKPENTKERILLVCVHCFQLSWCQVWESTTFICSEAWQSMSNMSATIYCVPCSWYTWHFVFLLHILRMLFVFWVLKLWELHPTGTNRLHANQVCLEHTREWRIILSWITEMKGKTIHGAKTSLNVLVYLIHSIFIIISFFFISPLPSLIRWPTHQCPQSTSLNKHFRCSCRVIKMRPQQGTSSSQK